MEYPKLIVTCSSSNVDLCIHEICNVIYPRDPGVRAEESGFRGVIFVYTVLDASRVYTVVSHREYGFVENIIPVYCTLRMPLSDSELLDCINRLNLPSRVKVKVRSRGVRGISLDLFEKITHVLKKHRRKHDPLSNTCLYVEVFREIIYVGSSDCQSVFKASTKIR